MIKVASLPAPSSEALSMGRALFCKLFGCSFWAWLFGELLAAEITKKYDY
jgi:hypothetical protein